MISLEQNEVLSLSVTSFNSWRLINSKASTKADDRIGETVKVKVAQTLNLKSVIVSLNRRLMLFKEVSSAQQACIYFIQATTKAVIL